MSEAPRNPRVAVVLFNLGGPDQPSAIRPFLLNLFKDPAILRVPPFIRPFLARWIAHRRVQPATENYAILGGKSPLLELTRKQATALEAALPEWDARCFIAMRYWHPMSDETAAAVAVWKPDHIILLPLYPQYSTTTTGSSFTAWRESAAKSGLAAPVSTLCCYPRDQSYVASIVENLRQSHDRLRAEIGPEFPIRVLFSAHGLPEVIVKRGDPYQFQIEQTAEEVLMAWGPSGVVESRICYQSRATPQVWLSPSTDEEIVAAGRDQVALLVCPIAFTSDHSETLVELDVEYRHLADEHGVPFYRRVPVQNDQPCFIRALADLARSAYSNGTGLCSGSGARLCPRAWGNCPHRSI